MNPFVKITTLNTGEKTQAQEALAKTLMELMLQKSVLKISVRELTQAAHVARSTFYAYYQNIDDLLDEVENNIVIALLYRDKKMMDQERQNAADFAYFSEIIDYVNEHEIYFAALLKTGDNDQRFILKWKQAIKYNLCGRVRPEMTDQNKFVLEMIASQTISAIDYYVNEHVRPKKQEIYDLVARTLKSFDL